MKGVKKWQVLISTYWNVKKLQITQLSEEVSVLISTYWNVKARGFDIKRITSTSFNLNLLECKCADDTLREWENYCFNLNLLECKYEQTESLLLGSLVLISTYWNVNMSKPKVCCSVHSF